MPTCAGQLGQSAPPEKIHLACQCHHPDQPGTDLDQAAAFNIHATKSEYLQCSTVYTIHCAGSVSLNLDDDGHDDTRESTRAARRREGLFLPSLR
jgi:hypothetical protein